MDKEYLFVQPSTKRKGESNMAMIPNLSEIPDKKPVDAGEYDLRISKVKETKSNRTGRYGLMLVIDIDGEDNAESIFHILWYGNYKDFQGDDEDKNNTMWRMVKDFLRSIGVDPEQENDSDDLVGMEFTAEVGFNDGMDTDEDGKPIKVGPPKNEILRVL
ncbi:MAG: hypothetical protein SVO01_00725 [Thermotogota bacterium]|nr:hypothetical protein [Thermotogota bacterium]